MKRNNLKDTLKEIDKISKLLIESYVFEDEPQMATEEGMPMREPMYGEEQMMSEPDMMATDKRIDQIRMIALEGIQEFADDVESEQYQFFKKVWLMCDKVYESGENTEK